MVEEAGGLDMNDSNSLAAVKAAMARPAEFSPKSVDSTRPSLYIETTDIEVDGQILANTSDYTSTDPHSFDAGISYTDVDGIVTFRGNNFRDTAAYGNTQIKNGKIQDLWTAKNRLYYLRRCHLVRKRLDRTASYGKMVPRSKRSP